VNANTPKFIRLAKTYLMGTMLSTNMGVARFDADAYVASGLDFMVVSIDGASQGVYEKFRKKGKLDLVLRNLEKLVQAKKRLGRQTPVIAWHYLAFEHNAHEIPMAYGLARQLGVNQFTTVVPFDVSWDDPEVRVANIEPSTVELDEYNGDHMIANWNPFPQGLEADAIEREFESRWAGAVEEEASASDFTCQWLYKKITMDAGGKVFPCCAAPQPHMDLVFANFDGTREAFNSDKYRLARLSFADRAAYERERDERQLDPEPYCGKCEWNKDTSATDRIVIEEYFKAVGGDLFDAQSLNVLSSW
jgi:MoaA/NifB/PqqE/SkfB family radical SAM enzyme